MNSCLVMQSVLIIVLRLLIGYRKCVIFQMNKCGLCITSVQKLYMHELQQLNLL